MTDVDLVVPTVGRPSLSTLLDALAGQAWRGRVFLVDDRPGPDTGLLDDGAPGRLETIVLRGRGGGPAAARNAGWRAATAPWVAFLDDDVVPDPDWGRRLQADLAACGPRVAGNKGRIVVPLPADRRPTDWERNVRGLEDAHWATADMAYRRDALRALGGFDEGFPRAYREDADLAWRARRAGWTLTEGTRQIAHPVRPAPWYVSLAKQSGNADDARMRRHHGPAWRVHARAPGGAFPVHLLTSVALAGAAVGAAGRRWGVTAVFGGAWLAATLRFAWRRIGPGPRTRREVAAMAATSVVIPPVAVWHRGVGTLRSWRMVAPRRSIDAVFFDRDGTLVHDVPYNGDPERVVVVDGAAEALDRLRAAGRVVGIVTNQSGISRGLITLADAERVHVRVAELLGPIDIVAVCPHGPDDGCACRKPRPGLVAHTAAALGVAPHRCAVVGDHHRDVAAAEAAGAMAILVPSAATPREDIARARLVAGDLATAVDLILGGTR